jgi:hypothetical protein
MATELTLLPVFVKVFNPSIVAHPAIPTTQEAEVERLQFKAQDPV